MSLSDLIYSDNPKRRRNVIRLRQEIQSAMDFNISATNDLINIMRDRLGASISTLTVDREKSIKDCAEMLIRKIEEIQSYLDGDLANYRSRIDPHLYEELLRDDLELSSAYDIIQKCATTLRKGLEIVVTIRTMVQTFQLVTISLKAVIPIAVRAMAIGALVIGVDLLISGVMGYMEKKDLEKIIRELKLIRDKIVPASRAYSKRINWLEFKIEERYGTS